MRRLLLISLVFLLLVAGWPGSTRAALKVAPIFQDIVVAPQGSGYTYPLTITNDSAKPEEVSLQSVDFGTLDESGGVAFVGMSSLKLNQKYSLVSWIQLEQDHFIVEPHSSKQIVVGIVNKSSLLPGGHYAAILVSENSDLGSSNTSHVDVRQAISTLMFVRKTGGEIYALALEPIEVSGSMLQLTERVNLRFHNTGNVHTVPHGLIEIFDPRGNEVARGVINESSGRVLPESFRRFTVGLRRTTSIWLPGKYTIRATYAYEGQVGSVTVTTYQYYLPPQSWVGMIFLLICLYALLRFFRYIRRHRA